MRFTGSEGKVVWIEYSIPADFEMQKRIIRQLRTWIEGIDEKGLVRGFAFDHYFNQSGVPDDLRVRFDYPEDVNPEVENELATRVRLVGSRILSTSQTVGQ